VTRRTQRLCLGLGFLLLYGWFLSATEVSLSRLVRGLPWMADFLRRMVPPLGFLSARTVVSQPIFYPARALLNFFRSIDTMVYALFFVAAVGLGPFPGVLAVVTYTTMTLAKLYSEAIEGIDQGPVDAVAATGAGRLQVLRFGILPQVVPLFASYVLYRLETNIRAATILGFVGAGGIGFYIQTYLRMINYPAAAAVLLVLVVMIMGVDFASSRLRARIV
jgi:phosphonate transport system permease protein